MAKSVKASTPLSTLFVLCIRTVYLVLHQFALLLTISCSDRPLDYEDCGRIGKKRTEEYQPIVNILNYISVHSLYH